MFVPPGPISIPTELSSEPFLLFFSGDFFAKEGLSCPNDGASGALGRIISPPDSFFGGSIFSFCSISLFSFFGSSFEGCDSFIQSGGGLTSSSLSIISLTFVLPLIFTVIDTFLIFHVLSEAFLSCLCCICCICCSLMVSLAFSISRTAWAALFRCRASRLKPVTPVESQ